MLYSKVFYAQKVLPEAYIQKIYQYQYKLSEHKCYQTKDPGLTVNVFSCLLSLIKVLFCNHILVLHTVQDHASCVMLWPSKGCFKIVFVSSSKHVIRHLCLR